MAKTATTPTAAKVPEVVDTPTNLPAKAGSTALAQREELPEYLREFGAEGADNITKDDIVMPRLALAQKMSPEVDPENAKFIEGLEIGDLFNSVTQEIYGQGPLEFVILRQDAPRYIEFVPREQGGGIKDMNVPPNDPRTMFTTGPDGKRVKPIATKFYDYLIMLIPSMEIIALSFKSTGLKAAKLLKTQILLNKTRRKLPIYGAKFRIESGSAENHHGKFKIYVVGNSTVLDDSTTAKDSKGNYIPGVVNEELFRMAKAYYDEFKEKVVTIDVDAGPDVDDDGPDRGQPDEPGM